MFYLFQPLNHLTNIKNWAKKHGVHLHISPDTFALTVTRSGRITRLQPRFVTKESGKIGYKREYENIGAFVGWVLPNTPTWPAASDKIFFKQQANALKLRIPAAWNNGEFLSEDYLIKIRNGSFGRDIQGPFKASRLRKPLSSASEYYEQFIPGRSAKAWCWNSQVVALEIVDPPYICGDGTRTLQEIATTVRGSMDATISLDGLETVLAWQDKTADSVPAAGERVWLDFKYVTPFDVTVFRDRDLWGSCSQTVRHQFAHAVALLHEHTPEGARGRNVYTLDAMIDTKDRVWFLEMNSHPMIHPNAYVPMLNDLVFSVSQSPIQETPLTENWSDHS